MIIDVSIRRFPVPLRLQPNLKFPQLKHDIQNYAVDIAAG